MTANEKELRVADRVRFTRPHHANHKKLKSLKGQLGTIDIMHETTGQALVTFDGVYNRWWIKPSRLDFIARPSDFMLDLIQLRRDMFRSGKSHPVALIVPKDVAEILGVKQGEYFGTHIVLHPKREIKEKMILVPAHFGFKSGGYSYVMLDTMTNVNPVVVIDGRGNVIVDEDMCSRQEGFNESIYSPEYARDRAFYFLGWIQKALKDAGMSDMMINVQYEPLRNAVYSTLPEEAGDDT